MSAKTLRFAFKASLSLMISGVIGVQTMASTSPAPAPRVAVSEQLGVSWLRDLQSPAVRTWVADQNRKSREYVSLDAAGAQTQLYTDLTARAKELVPSNPPPMISTPFGKLVQKAGGLVLVDASGAESVIAGKITEADGSGWQSVNEIKVSPDFTKVAYAYVKNNSDTMNWYVYDLQSKNVLTGPMLVRLAGLGWASDSSGVYFTQWATDAELKKGIHYTRNIFRDLAAGTDELVFKVNHPDIRDIYIVEDIMIDGERVMIAYRNQVVAEIPMGIYMGRVKTADTAKGEFQVGAVAWKAVRVSKSNVLGKLIAFNGSKLILRTSEVGDGFGIVELDIKPMLRGRGARKKTLVKEKAGEVLILAQQAGDKILAQYFDKKTFKFRYEVLTLKGRELATFKLSDHGLLDVGAPSTFTVSANSKEAYFVINDFRFPNTTVRMDLANLKLEVLPSAQPMAFDASKVAHELNWVKSLDGTTMVPVNVYSRNDIAKPTFGYVFYYGYIGIAHFPWWSRKIQMILDMGGAVMMVHHRGGGEQGADWQLGVKVDRLASYEDTVAATRWLKNKYGITKVAASGRSFGGMHTLGLMAHYSDEFDLFAPVVSVADVNEFLDLGLFGQMAVDDFGIERGRLGEPLDTPEFRERLAVWSPLANFGKIQSLKPTFIFTADNDERTGPEQSYFVAEALNKQFPGNDKVFLYEEKHNGHNARTELIDELAFIAKEFGVSYFAPLK